MLHSLTRKLEINSLWHNRTDITCRRYIADGPTPADASKKGDTFVRDFCKMTQDKREQRYLKEEKEFRKDQATCS